MDTDSSIRIAITADLHWGHNALGDEATLALVQHLKAQPPDLLLLGGDQGTEEHFGECLELFDGFSHPKALVPGNHDIWVADPDPRGDSQTLYQQYLPDLCVEHGFQYLDRGPLLLPEAGLAIVGSINWYDYSWSLDRLRLEVPDWDWRLRTKTFTRGRHNDGRFVRWPLDDVAFTRQVVETLAGHLGAALQAVPRALVLTHHPALYRLSFPRAEPPQGVDGLMWDALSGNAGLEEILRREGERLAGIFSGHTHRERAGALGSVPAHNIGGDYHFKRLLIMNWPAGTVEAYTFGDPGARRS